MRQTILLLITLFIGSLVIPHLSMAAGCSNVGDACCQEPVTGVKSCLNGLTCTNNVCAATPPANKPLCGSDDKGVNTAIGCLMAGDPKQLVSQLLGWGVSVGGGIAFLMIIVAGFQMTTAAGDAKRVQAARELMVSAISGLILIAMSLVILNFLGYGILKLPGFKVDFN